MAPESEDTAPPGAEPEEIETAISPAAAVPQDADDTRGRHLRSLSRNPWVIGLTLFFVIGAFIAATVGAGIAIGGGAAGAMLLLAILIVFVLATNRAKEDFFSSYAAARGLNRQHEGLAAADARRCSARAIAATPSRS